MHNQEALLCPIRHEIGGAGGTLENAQAIAAHESPRTTKLYDRTADIITLDEVERICDLANRPLPLTDLDESCSSPSAFQDPGLRGLEDVSLRILT
jgi:hypothetical protein